jgi:hypothetical protein
MKKILLLLFLTVITTVAIVAQPVFTRQVFSAAYTAISTGGGATVSTATGDDGFQTALSIGFNFNYNGTDYTALGISTNGNVFLGPTTPTAAESRANNNLFTTTGPNLVLAPWMDDLTDDVGSEILYQLQGSPGTQTFTIQFTNYPNYFSGGTSMLLNFQVILYEGSNEIEFRYGSTSGSSPSASSSASIGLAWGTGAPGSYIDAISGSSYTSIGTLNPLANWPSNHFRFTPGAPTAIAGGTYNVGIGEVYTSLSNAIADINHRGITGPITLNLTNALYNELPANGSNTFPILLGPVTGNNSSNTITISSSGTAEINNSIALTAGNYGNMGSATVGSTSNIPVFGLIGADYVTMQNIKLSTLTGSTGADAGLLVGNSSATDGSTNNTFQNFEISLGRDNTSSKGIFQTVLTPPTNATGANSNNKYYNFSVRNAFSGVFLSGNATYPDLNTEIGTSACGTYNSIGDPLVSNDIGLSTSATQTYGIRAANQSNVAIFNNNINNVGNSGIVDGILIETFQGTSSVYNNKIATIRNTSTSSTSSAVGIRATHPTTGTHNLRIYNNFINDITRGYTGTATASRYIKGINISGTGGVATINYFIDFNTVRIDGSGSPNCSSSSFEIATTSGPAFLVRNNVFANLTAAQGATANHSGFFSSSATAIGNTGSLFAYNDMYVPNDNGTSGFAAIGNTTKYNLVTNMEGGFTTPTPPSNNMEIDPSFISPTDIHTSAPGLDGMADPAYTVNTPWITLDIDCATRNNPSDIGADEYDVLALDMGASAFVAPSNSATGCYTNAETVTVTIKNYAGTTIDFSVNPVTVTTNVTGAVVTSLSATVNSGTLASGASMDVNMSTTLDMTTAGTYNFTASTAVTGDGNSSNDDLPSAVTRTKNTLTAGTATANPNSFCVVGGKPTLTLTGHTGYSNIQWQESTTSMSGYTDISGANTSPYTLGIDITQTMYYQAVLTCGSSTATSSEDTATLNNPQISTSTPGSRCGPGTVNLSATGTGSGINWYANPTGGVALGSGNSFTTPFISTTTTFYAAANNGSTTSGITGDGGWNHVTALGGYQTSLITGSYMILTVLQDLTLSSLDIYPSATIGTTFGLEARTVSQSGPTFASYSGTTTVQNAATPTVAQTVPVNWVLPAGTYYIGFTGTNPNTWRSGSFAHGLPWTEPGLATLNFALSPSYQYYFYNLQLTTSCESSPRTSVTATINTPPAIDVSTSSPLNICVGGSSTLNVTSGNAGYTYNWTPGNMPGTGVVVNPASTQKYYVNATDNSGGPNDGCSALDSVTITVQNPQLDEITPAYAYSCSGGGAKLDALINKILGTQSNASVPISGSEPNAFQYYYEGNKQQAIVLASELNALGISGTTTIHKIGFEMTAANFLNFSNVIIKMGHTTSSAYSSSTDWKTGLTTVYTAATITITGSGWQTLTFSTPFVWNGTDNIVIEFIQATGDWDSGTMNSGTYSSTSFNSTLFYRADGLSQAAFEAYVGAATSMQMFRQNMKFYIEASSLNPIWSPITQLFTDPGLSTPYTGTPNATVYAAPASNTNYSVTGNDGLCATNTLNRDVFAYTAGTWNGSVSNEWTNATNWCGGVPTSSTDIVIPFTAPNMPYISSGNQEGASITFNSGTNLSFMTGTSLKVNNLTSNGAVISGSGGKLNVSDVLNVNSGILSIVDNNVVLQSTATKTARIAPISSGSILGNVTVERYIPAKATRKWSLLSSPITQALDFSWQQQIHITGAGTGGTICPTLTAHSNGFDATLTNASNIYTYNAAGTPGSRWTAVASTNSDNLMAGKGFRVNVRGDRSLGCDLLNGVNMTPSAVTIKSTGSISNSDKNMGSFSITYPNAGINNYVLVGNPYPSALSFSALQGANGSSISTSYAVYIPASAPGVYSYWSDDDGFFTGGSGYDDAKGNTIASGQAVFVQSLVAGDITLNYTESQKDIEGTAGYFKANTKDRVRISLNKDEKIDEVVIRYANDATVSNTTIGKKDIPSMNYGTYITSLKGTTHTAVQTRSLSTLSTDEVWLNIGATQSGNYSLSFSQYEDFAGADIYLVDHLAKTTQNIKENATYVFSVDVNNAATKGSARFSLVFTKRSVEPTIVYNSIKMYPNPANTQVTLLLPQSADIRYQIKVTDMTGKVVMQSKAAGGTTQMNINRLTKGAYLVEVTDSKGNRTTEKLIKN